MQANLPKIHQKTIKAKCFPTIGITPGKSSGKPVRKNDTIIAVPTPKIIS